jgi:hypothetical protein
VGRGGRPRADDRGRVRHGRGHLDELRRVARRPHNRLRPRRRHLPNAHQRRQRRATLGRRFVGSPAALLARRTAHRLHLRPRRRRQHLGHGLGRQEPSAGHERDFAAAEHADVDARRPIHSRAQALRGHALARRGRNLDVPRQRRGQGRAVDREAELDCEQRRARRRPRGALRLLRDEQCVRLQQERLRRHLLDRPLRHAERATLDLRARRRRLDTPRRLARRKIPLLHTPRRPEVRPLPARDSDGARVARLRRADARPAGDVGRLRHLSGLRLDARRKINRHHGDGQVRARGR